MAIKEWSTNYPTAIDTATEQPTLVNNADATRVSQIHTMRDAVQALQSQMGTTALSPLTSMRARMAARENKLPRLAWNTATQVDIAAAPGEPSTVYATLQDGKTRSFSGTKTFDPSVSGDGGLDTGSEASDTWYYLYLVPDSGDDDALEVRGSVSTPSTGPDSETNFEYIGAVRNDSSSDLEKFYQITADRFAYESRKTAGSFGSTLHTSGTTLALDSYIPKTASLAHVVAAGNKTDADTFGPTSEIFVNIGIFGTTNSLVETTTGALRKGRALLEGWVPTSGATKQATWVSFEVGGGAAALTSSFAFVNGWIDENLS